MNAKSCGRAFGVENGSPNCEVLSCTRVKGSEREPCRAPWGACEKLLSAAIYKKCVSLETCSSLVAQSHLKKLPRDELRRKSIRKEIRRKSLNRFARSHLSRIDLRDFLLRPLEIAADLARIAHTVLEALASLSKAGLRLLLQIHQLAVLGVELSRSAV